MSLNIRDAINEFVKMGLIKKETNIPLEFLSGPRFPIFRITDEGIKAVEEFILQLIEKTKELKEMHEILRNKLPSIADRKTATIVKLLSDPSFWGNKVLPHVYWFSSRESDI